jgi:hypothetical protein
MQVRAVVYLDGLDGLGTSGVFGAIRSGMGIPVFFLVSDESWRTKFSSIPVIATFCMRP